MSNVNKARYERLVTKAKASTRRNVYIEVHHIIPRSEGGTDAPDNLVELTAREHFLAHWLLYRIYKTPASARAFKLMVNDQKRRRGRDYAEARQVMSESMRGENNVSKRPEVRQKLKQNASKPFLGKKRPEHSAAMKSKGLILGERNPFFGAGHRQLGEKNHMARKVVGLHIYHGIACWPTATEAAKSLGVTLQAVAQAVRRNARSKGWRLEYVS